MKNKKYILEILKETKKDLFKTLAIRKKIEFEIQKYISLSLKEKLYGKKERFNTNSYYSFFDFRITFDEYLEKVEYVIYYVLIENITEEKQKEIDKFKSNFSRQMKEEYIFESHEIPSIKSMRYKVDIEKIFENGLTI